MTSAESISIIIDSLIQRINNVKVCPDHWKLVGSNLRQLRHKVNENDRMKNSGPLQEAMGQTLKLIDGAVTSCTESETNRSRVTYRDLEAFLLRLQLSLVQHEVDLTDDYQTKVEILSKNYHKQQTLAQKLFDETMKRQSETAEQETKANTEKQLDLLHKKYAPIIESYLRRCTELHKSVPLSGITGVTVAKIANNFYDISAANQIQLEHNWQICELPLTRSFLQFKPDKSTSFERNESRRLLIGPEVNLLHGPHGMREASKRRWQILVSAPYMMSMIERDRYEQEEDFSEENIIRTKRWIVILGDPGSGKTSFARWLIRHLAQTLLVNGQHSTDYGPLRIPILVRIGEFAEMLKGQPSLTLFDYIGKHKWMGKSIVDDSSISLGNLSCALQDYIKHGQALVILDGLDEIPVSDQRSLIMNIVEHFVDNYVQTYKGASAYDNPHLSKLLDDPSKSGGNQLIVTSRIVGYHAAPLAGQFAHYTIRPMGIEHMKDFVDYWFFRVHQQILDTLELTVTNQGQSHSEALKNELEKKENTGLRDVASNSCLMSFICSVAFSQVEGSPLPTQRIHLYEEIVNSMLSLWSSKGSTIHVPKLIRILSDIATHIHNHSASGLIHEDKMKEICIQSIKSFLNKKLHTDEDLRNITNQASAFVRIFREDVGILAARGESLYGFLHLTFQEYFTCLKLIDVDKLKREKLTANESCSENKVRLVSQSLRQHTMDPRFRVPIALALGRISATWSQQDFDDFCLDFIQEQNESDSLVPLGAYRLISCGNDLVNYPSHDVLFNALDCLMIAAGRHKWSIICPFLFDQLSNALRTFHHNILSLWIHNFLSRSHSHDIQTISALCHLLEGKPHQFENIKWLNQSLCLILQNFSSLDGEANEFAIDRLLVKIAFFNHRLLPINSISLKEFLITHEIELKSIPVVLFPLIITLYGGLKRNGQTIVFDPFHIYRESRTVTPILIRFFSKLSHDEQDQNIIIVKEECVRILQARIQNRDESSGTVDVCIATICLYGIDYVRENAKTISNSLMYMSMNRLKYISMILRQFYFTDDEDDHSTENETTKFISSVIENFQFGKSARLQFLDLLNSLKSGLARLRSSTTSILLEGKSAPDKRLTLYLPDTLRKQYTFLNDILLPDLEWDSDRKSCSLLQHFTKIFWILENNDEYCTQYRMAVAMDTVPEYILFRNDKDLLFSFTFVPPHLQSLYLRLLEQKFIMVDSKDFTNDAKYYLYFSHILTECLMLLSNASCKKLTILAALITLLPWLRMQRLENFGGSLLWVLASTESDLLDAFEKTRYHPMNYETGQYMNRVETITVGENMTGGNRRKLIQDGIEQEHERLQNTLTDKDERNMKLYSASISLVHVCRWAEDERRLYLLNKSLQGAMLITNKITRLDAMCVIALYSHSDYDQIQVSTGRSVQGEIEHQLNDIYPTLPLLLHTAIFIRCLPLLQNQKMINTCLENIFNKFANADQRDQQVVCEALSPYVESFSPLSSAMRDKILHHRSRSMRNRSSILKGYLDTNADEGFSSFLLVSSMYLVEIASDIHEFIGVDEHHLSVTHPDFNEIDKSFPTSLFHFENSILTVAQASTITNILSSISLTNRAEYSRKLCTTLSNALHHVSLIEFRARYSLESWMKLKDSSELSSFAWHAALLLTNSDLWSVDAATILCDLLYNENDRFRQRAEIIFRLSNDNDVRTSSKLSLNVLLILFQRYAYYQHTSSYASLILSRSFENTTVDVQSHLEALLWLERYRIHRFANNKCFLGGSTLFPIPYIVSYLPTDNTIDVSFGNSIKRTSNDLVQYLSNLITSNFSSFLAIEDDTTSNAVLESHVQFVISLLICVGTFFNYNDEGQVLTIDALNTLLETSTSDEIRQAAVFALGNICDKGTCKILFNSIQPVMNNEAIDTSHYSDVVIQTLISSYCHCVSIKEIDFEQRDIDLFRMLLKHPSQNVLKAVHIGLARVLKQNSLLLEMLNSDAIQCYHALIGATAYLFAYDVRQHSADITAEFIEEHSELLPIFLVEVYNSIRHFTNCVQHMKTIDYYLAYGYPQYVEVASLVAVRIPAAFCAFVKDWQDGDSFKRALFYTSKQHHYPQRAACLTILSLFGELTVELCQMIIEALRDDSQIQNICYRCLTRINSIKDEKGVLNLLFSYLKSKSMSVRYVTAKLLLHLSQSALISFNQTQTALNDLMLDLSSNENLWLIQEQGNVEKVTIYTNVGPLKDVIYSLLVQHLTGDASGTALRNELNDIDLDFDESRKAGRLSSCVYGNETKESLAEKRHSKLTYLFDDSEDSTSSDSSSTEYESDQHKRPCIDERQELDDRQMSLENEQALVEDIVAPIDSIEINDGNEEHAGGNTVKASVVRKAINSQLPSLQTGISTPKKSKLCTII